MWNNCRLKGDTELTRKITEKINKMKLMKLAVEAKA